MTRGTTIIDLRAERGSDQPYDHAVAAADEAVAPAPAPWRDRIAATLAIAAACAWIAALALALPPVTGDPAAIIGLIGTAAAPLALIALLYLLVVRSGSAEGARFERSAMRMRAEARRLDTGVGALLVRLDEGRAALTGELDDLVARGNGAAEQLGTIAADVAREIAAIDAGTHKLIQGSSAARADLAVLMDTLPQASVATRELAGELQRTDLAAATSAAGLDERLHALAARRADVEQITADGTQRLTGELARIRTETDMAVLQMGQAGAAMAAALDTALGRSAAAIEESGRTLAQQGEAVAATLNAGGSAIAHAGGAAIDALAGRIAALEAGVAAIAERLSGQQDAGLALIARLNRDVDAAEARLSQLDETGAQRTGRLADAITALRAEAEAMAGTLATGEGRAETLLIKAEALLLALDANAREIDETLPRALDRLDARLGGVRSALGPVAAEVEALVAPSERAQQAAAALAALIEGQAERLGEADAASSAHLAHARRESEALVEMVRGLTAQAEGFADSAGPRLVEALLRVRDTAAQASDHARNALATVIPDAARDLADSGGSALGAAVGDIIRTRVTELAQASEAAMDAANRASDRLMRQMVTIAETTAQVEQRFADAAAEREEHGEESFARRVSLLLEALNSASIDVTRILSAEVADTAWATYLKGDRGVFTRRAVELLDAQQAKDLARLYEGDDAVRGMVNRYVHDFEAMLRVVLASREGGTLGVTLLSSDMGKLYVAIAQAIERLRL